MTTATAQAEKGAGRIQPWGENPRFWQYGGKPVWLLGGSVKDNLFQIPDLEAHLDLLVSVGGNYIRNTMSDRPDQGFEIKAFARGEDGRYDLSHWNDAYWQRFEMLLQLTSARDIIVQIEMWDRFDHGQDNWQSDPYNPTNNINYGHDESGLAAEYPDHPGSNGQPFFYTVPELGDNRVVLPFQQAFIDKVLSCSLKYDNILYCMDNETSGDPAWGRYWAKYVGDAAAIAGVDVEITEMWDHWDVRHETHRPTFDHPELYTFVDIAQNSHNPGQTNWERAQWVRAYLADHPRPMNSTKIYGADTSKWTDRGVSAEHGQQVFWRNLIGGFASSRFHRPPSGLGLSETAQANLRSARMLQAHFDVFHAEADADFQLLSDRDENEAYAAVVSGRQYAVYFPDGGQVRLDAGDVPVGVNLTVAVMDIAASRWLDGVSLAAGGGMIDLRTPPGPHIALVTKD
ncbi:MAG TPA: hypothetical protein QGF95_23855 [Candidatus Latescibacteria bacterium]|jgi:hypothetical protein|nr:hypothetical protein [Candidatus Latescibacterota bacterium]HJP33598.1 hypothetical protein [Candidatus Latescibacterota bacterium]